MSDNSVPVLMVECHVCKKKPIFHCRGWRLVEIDGKRLFVCKMCDVRYRYYETVASFFESYNCTERESGFEDDYVEDCDACNEYVGAHNTVSIDGYLAGVSTPYKVCEDCLNDLERFIKYSPEATEARKAVVNANANARRSNIKSADLLG